MKCSSTLLKETSPTLSYSSVTVHVWCYNPLAHRFQRYSLWARSGVQSPLIWPLVLLLGCRVDTCTACWSSLKQIWDKQCMLHTSALPSLGPHHSAHTCWPKTGTACGIVLDWQRWMPWVVQSWTNWNRCSEYYIQHTEERLGHGQSTGPIQPWTSPTTPLTWPVGPDTLDILS